jgi:tRNA(Ile)-lysidine synthase
MKTKRNLVPLFERYCLEKSLIRHGDSIIVAVSGGIDSMTLLHLFSRIQRKYGLRLIVAHFNHQLRGKESDLDEAFVERLASKYGYASAIGRGDITGLAKKRKISIQEAARELRYRFLEGLLKERNADKIATAHNANDNAETVLLNLCRGTGIHGLSGIPVYRPDLHLIRPLLFATRSEIEAYAKRNGLKHRTDSSNRKLHYKRNIIRKKVLPLLAESLNPKVVETLNRSSEIFSRLEDMILHEANNALETLTKKKTDNILVLDSSEFMKLHPYMQETIIELAAKPFTGIPLESRGVASVLSLLSSQTGARVEVSNKLTVYRDREHLVFLPGARKLKLEEEVKPNRSYEFGKIRFSSSIVHPKDVRWTHDRHTEYVDADKLNERMILRSWKQGDRFVPFGMEDPKKLSDFFIDEKIPRYEKGSIPVLESHGNIVWICGVRLDNRYRITPSTKRVLKLEFDHKES